MSWLNIFKVLFFGAFIGSLATGLVCEKQYSNLLPDQEIYRHQGSYQYYLGHGEEVMTSAVLTDDDWIWVSQYQKYSTEEDFDWDGVVLKYFSEEPFSVNGIPSEYSYLDRSYYREVNWDLQRSYDEQGFDELSSLDAPVYLLVYRKQGKASPDYVSVNINDLTDHPSQFFADK